MKKSILIGLATILSVNFCAGQNLLAIPDTLSGTNFNLSIKDTSKVFYSSFVTNTIGINANYLGPTLLLNKGDSINISIDNMLMDTTTIHWHGMHVSALNDGGPHIVIPPGTNWNPKFKVRDHAATYWYHSHLHMMTNMQATMGEAGVIIVRDSTEATLALPRRYGVDDFPLVIQSKCFDVTKQIVVGNPYDSTMMVNGTIDPYLPSPAQVIRYRLLNASSERVYYLGLTGNMTFQQIASDGGLLNAPVALTRLQLAPGERAEILINFTGMIGQNISLISYSSELPNGVYGATQPGMGPGQVIPGYTSNPLNGLDFNIITFNIIAATSNPITTIPASLVVNTPYSISSSNANRVLTFTPLNMGPTAIQGPFEINNTPFNMNVVNYSIPLDNIEIWTLDNQSPISHPFHIHDVQFFITEINGVTPPVNMQGRKDVVLVPAMQTVRFITKFETFCDSMATYMYHCHMLPHEDEGMMGQFVVTCPVGIGMENFPQVESRISIYPNPSDGIYSIETNDHEIKTIIVTDNLGRKITEETMTGNKISIDLSVQGSGVYFITVQTSVSSATHKIIKY